MKATKTRIEYMRNPMGLDICAPFLSWNCSGGLRQTAYRIVAVSGSETIWDSGKVETRDMGCRFGGELHSRQRISWKICLWYENGEPWSWKEMKNIWQLENTVLQRSQHYEKKQLQR